MIDCLADLLCEWTIHVMQMLIVKDVFLLIRKYAKGSWSKGLRKRPNAAAAGLKCKACNF